ncbi:LOW QUALITY PROTEIN: meiosis regulator and mRNA stability factor 1 [Dermacentor andersoni]|uniref:LOW QUALITY PROTEIN: meiosis regulator and mRNA stability factor 1 n=1 Tax=Dermacentor andersoni TaxID=34620 RepID=UPI002417D143|nr:LOW QUALITY PROTEIN: meiosis regulator and mRNA stability factor 1-like [Dermacentor andersoni]
MQALDSKKDIQGQVPIGVFWDIENCQVPRGKSATALVGRIRQLFFRGHAEAEFLCVCDIRKELPEVVQELNLAQVTVVHINAVSKNAADDKLKQCMRRFVDIHGSPATLVLISGDVNFSTDLSDFRHRRQIRVVLVHGGSAPEALTACAHESYSFAEVASGVPFRTPRREGVHCLELMVTNLPMTKSPGKLKSRLKQLSENCGGRVTSISGGTAFLKYPTTNAALSGEVSENCGGRVTSISGGTAFLKYPTTNAALRSRVRMDGENVCGNVISVSLHTPRQRRSRSCQSGAKRSSSSSSRSPESSSVEADNYQMLTSQRRNDRFPVVDMWNPDVATTSLAGPDIAAPVEFKRPRSVGRVSPFMRSSSQPEVPSVQTSGGAQVPDPLSGRTVGMPSRHRSCSPTKTGNLPLFYGIPRMCEGVPAQAGLQALPGSLVQALPLHRHQNAIACGGNIALEERLQNVSLQEPSNTPACIRVSNLDPNIEINDLKRLLLAVFREHVTVLNITLNVQRDGNVKAYVHVPNAFEAIRAFKHIHQRRLGLYCLHLSVDDKVLVQLPSQHLQTGSPLYCPIHDNSTPVAASPGTPRLLLKPLPEVCLPRATWITQLGKLLDIHDGSLLLDSFKACYRAEFGPLPMATKLEKWQAGTVPLEHLVASVPGVSVVTSKRGFKRAKREPPKQIGSVKKGSTMEEFASKMVDLLCAQPHCRLELGRFQEVYKNHYSRPICLLNFACSKVSDLMANIPEVVEVLGHGSNGIITLTHEEQMKRFVSDIERLFKKPDAPKTMSLSTLLSHFQGAYNRPLEVADYGMCTLDDLLDAVPATVLVVERKEGNTFITYPDLVSPDPTMEQAERLRQFAKELVCLLGPTGDRGLPLSELSAAYQQLFGRPLRISNYRPFGKLAHLIQAISDVAEVRSSGSRKMVRLAPSYRHPTSQPPPVAKEVCFLFMASTLRSHKSNPLAYANRDAHTSHLGNTTGLRSVLGKYVYCEISELFTIHGHGRHGKERKRGNSKKTAWRRGGMRSASWTCCPSPTAVWLDQLWVAFHERCGSYPNLSLLRGLEHNDCIVFYRDAGRVKLSPRYRLAWQLRRLLWSLTEPGEEPRLSLALLEDAYRRRHGKPPPLQQLHFESLEELLESVPKYFTLSGDRDSRSVSLVKVNRGPKVTVEEPHLLEPTRASSPVNNLSACADDTASSLESGTEPELLVLCPLPEPELMQLCPEPELMQLCTLPEPELLELFPPSDDDLLDRPIPSNLPSPVICPEISPAGDLMQFDTADNDTRPSSEADSAEILDSVSSATQPTRKKRLAALFPVPLAQ